MIKLALKRFIFNSIGRIVIKSQTLPIFLVHGIVREPHGIFEKKFDLVKPEEFFATLKFLKEYLDFLPMSRAIYELEAGMDMRGKCVLTFDDGYRCIKEYGYPILQDIQVPATNFIIPSIIDNNKLFWRDQIRVLDLTGNLEKFKKYFFKDSMRAKFYESLKDLTVYQWSKVNPKGVSSFSVIEALNNFFLEEGISWSQFSREGQEPLYLTSDDIKYSGPLIEYGNHTFSHPVLTSIDAEHQYQEIMKADKFLNGFSNVLSGVLSLPFGMGDRSTFRAAKKANVNYMLSHSNSISFNNYPSKEKSIDRINLPRNREDYLVKIIKDCSAS